MLYRMAAPEDLEMEIEEESEAPHELGLVLQCPIDSLPIIMRKIDPIERSESGDQSLEFLHDLIREGGQ